MLRFGATRQGDDSFPRTEVCNLDPARIFRAAFTSRSCSAPQAEQHHRLTASCLGPLGPLRHPQLEQARVVNRSFTMTTDLPACSPLYCSICLSIPQPLSRTAFAIRVFTSRGLLTSPTAMYWYSFTIRRLNLCSASRRRFSALRCRRFA